MLITGKFSFGEYELDCDRRLLSRSGEPLNLYPKAFDLLEHLVENRGRAVSKDELLEHVWPGQFVEENNLTVQVSALRKMFGDTNGSKRFITTVPGKGYRFVAAVADVTPEDVDTEILIENLTVSRVVVEEYVMSGAAEALSSPAAIQQGTAVKRKTARVVVPVLALFLAAMLFGGYVWQRQNAERRVPFSQLSISRLTGSGKVDAAALSPDGKLFAYSVLGTRSLWIGHPDGGEPVELRPAGDTRYRHLSFSPDSGKLYYIATGKEHPTGALFRISVFGGVPEKLRENIRTFISFAPDMDRFVFVRDNPEKATSSLIISDVAATFERELASRPLRHGFDSSTAAWSPDGLAIAVGAIEDVPYGDHVEIFAVSAADGSIEAVTREKFRVIENVVWIKDGSGLLFTASEASTLDNKLRHASYPDGAVTLLNPDLNNYTSSIGLSSANDKLLLVKAEYLSNIWIAPRDSLLNAKQITFSSIGDRVGRAGMDWMPDGRIVYAALAGTGQALWTMEAVGSKQKQLTPTGSTDVNPSVTADAQTVVFSSRRSGASEMWRVNADGGDLRQLTSGGNNDMGCVSPDGKWVVFVATRDRETPGVLSRIPSPGESPRNSAMYPRFGFVYHPIAKWSLFKGA